LRLGEFRTVLTVMVVMMVVVVIVSGHGIALAVAYGVFGALSSAGYDVSRRQ